ncbi:GbsR/MarR family transcriptional regulator [Singulisphaera rosea]
MSTEDNERPETWEPGEHADPQAASGTSEIIRQFVEHWGMMARSWGINSTMGELFALLYISGTDWTADDLRERLQVSRGNVSMNLRELMAWGVVHKIHRQGERREFYRAETDVWTLFRRILAERKRRELDPTLVVLQKSVAKVRQEPGLDDLEARISALQNFFGLINSLAIRMLKLETEDLADLQLLLGDPEEAPPPQ